jgi:hypothetical protein
MVWDERIVEAHVVVGGDREPTLAATEATEPPP